MTNEFDDPTPEPVFEVRSLDDLFLHPLHEEFARPADHEIENLKEDIERRGLQHPIEITPDGVVLAGRKRCMALSELGYAEVLCRVRYDLADADEATMAQHVLADNIVRHQASSLELARAYKLLRENWPHPPTGDLRDAIGEFLNMSGRSLDRLSRVLKTPRPIQDAFEAGRLTLLEANRIASMPPAQQEAIATEIARSVEPKAALAAAEGRDLKKIEPKRPPTPTNSPPLMALVSATSAFVDACQDNGTELLEEQRTVLAHVIDRLASVQ